MPPLYSPPAVIAAEVEFASSFTVSDYTAKLVKTLLITGNPALGRLFERGEGACPKPIHITPLYAEPDKPLYPRYVPKDRKRLGPPPKEAVRPVRVEEGRKYLFYVGAPLSLLPDVLAALSNCNDFEFGKRRVRVRDVSYMIKYVDVEGEAKVLASQLERVSEGGGQRAELKVTFSTPALFKDPFAVGRWRKRHKLLVPLPDAVLSVPLYMLLLDKGVYRQSLHLRLLRHVKTVLDLPYTERGTAWLVWYRYGDSLLPALIGYAAYFVDGEALGYAQAATLSRYGLDFTRLLSEALVLAGVYGVGDGRAAGFGHASFSLRT